MSAPARQQLVTRVSPETKARLERWASFGTSLTKVLERAGAGFARMTLARLPQDQHVAYVADRLPGARRRRVTAKQGPTVAVSAEMNAEAKA